MRSCDLVDGATGKTVAHIFNNSFILEIHHKKMALLTAELVKLNQVQ
jgi:hypothetical protein